ncbi:helix-turn-helix transcriptional regulator [Marinomonas sp.]|uniref:helix-turn-helix transcriptional regulator n=1 Tax=Marinomonas sp. TaxID=1904862 RepID=UPI003BA8C478
MIESFLNQLLPKIYSCVQHPQRWTSILDELREKLEVESIAAQIYEVSDDYNLAEVWLMRDSQSIINADLHDKWVNNCDNPRLDYDFTDHLSIIRDEERFSSNCPRFQNFQKRLAQAGLGLAISLEMKISPTRYLNLIAHRKHGDSRPFDANSEQLLQLLAPHIQQTILLHDQFQALSTNNTIIKQTADKLTTGIMLINQYGKVSWHNNSAVAIIAEADYLDLIDNELRFHHKADRDIFFHLLQQTLSPTECTSYPLSRIGEYQSCPIQLLLTPIASTQSVELLQSKQPLTFALFLSNSHSEVALSDHNIGRLFGLTPAEVKLASALANGFSLTEYSNDKGISVGTARIQLKSIFSKMGVTRQPELVKTLWSSILPHVNQLQNELLSHKINRL